MVRRMLIAVLALGAVQARAADPEVKFEKYRLQNGLTIILSEDHRLPQVAVNVWYHVGAANQTPSRSPGFRIPCLPAAGGRIFSHCFLIGSAMSPNWPHPNSKLTKLMLAEIGAPRS